MKWISVKDKLPEKLDMHKDMLTWSKKHGLEMGQYCRKFSGNNFYYHMELHDEVTHWIYLDDVPKPKL